MRYFISGHRDLTIKEFEKHYVPQILKVLRDDSEAEFIVGDWEGCDTFAQEFLGNLHAIIEVCDYKHFKSYDACDIYMTKHSDFDIAWIRKGREDSHTANNIKRRYNL